jgi:hypothetical protein
MKKKKKYEIPVTKGPDRVMCKSDEAIGFKRAVAKYNINLHVMFLRSDGWILGAPKRFEKEAYESWKEYWTHFAYKPALVWTDISEYREVS